MVWASASCCHLSFWPVATYTLILRLDRTYYYGPSTYDRSWNAALAAMQDVGVSIVSSDKNGGVITGIPDGVDHCHDQGQADGQVRVVFNSRGPPGRIPDGRPDLPGL